MSLFTRLPEQHTGTHASLACLPPRPTPLGPPPPFSQPPPPQPQCAGPLPCLPRHQFDRNIEYRLGSLPGAFLKQLNIHLHLGYHHPHSGRGWVLLSSDPNGGGGGRIPRFLTPSLRHNLILFYVWFVGSGLVNVLYFIVCCKIGRGRRQRQKLFSVLRINFDLRIYDKNLLDCFHLHEAVFRQGTVSAAWAALSSFTVYPALSRCCLKKAK